VSLGTFNVVRCVEERWSLRVVSHSTYHISFNQFIYDNIVVDLPLCGPKYTWDVHESY